MKLTSLPIVSAIRRMRECNYYNKKSLKWYHDNHDPVQIVETTPPEDEKIEFHCSWVSEAYTPSSIGQLIKSLHKLGWDYPVSETGPGLCEWIMQGRSLGGGRSWIAGPTIFSRYDRSHAFSPRRKYDVLPDGVNYVSLSIRNVTASLTLVNARFEFQDTVAFSLKELLDASYKTKLSKTRPDGSQYVLDIATQKRRAVQDQMTAVHQSLYHWFRERLPGHFSTSLPEPFPTIALITSHAYVQSSEPDKRVIEDYLDVLFDRGVEIWKHGEGKLEFRISGHGGSSTGTLFGNYNDLTLDTDQYGGKSRGALIGKINHEVDAFMGVWASHSLLRTLERRLSRIRDNASLSVRRSRGALKTLDYVRREFLTVSVDVQVICSDFARFVKSTKTYSRGCLDFVPPEYLKKFVPSFVEGTRQQDKMRIEELNRLEPRVNSALIASANLTSAIANLRLQRNVFLLTILVAILTLVSVLVTSTSVFE